MERKEKGEREKVRGGEKEERWVRKSGGVGGGRK